MLLLYYIVYVLINIDRNTMFSANVKKKVSYYFDFFSCVVSCASLRLWFLFLISFSDLSRFCSGKIGLRLVLNSRAVHNMIIATNPTEIENFGICYLIFQYLVWYLFHIFKKIDIRYGIWYNSEVPTLKYILSYTIYINIDILSYTYYWKNQIRKIIVF